MNAKQYQANTPIVAKRFEQKIDLGMQLIGADDRQQIRCIQQAENGYELQPANSDSSLPVTDVIDMLGETAKFVRFTAHPLLGTTTDPPADYNSASGNWGDATRLGLSEVEFFVVPEPSTLVLLGIGMLGLAACRRA